MKLILTSYNKKVKIEKYDGKDLISQYISTFSNQSDFTKCANVLDIEYKLLINLLKKFTGEKLEHDTSISIYNITIQSIVTGEKHEIENADIGNILQNKPQMIDPRMVWEDASALCCVDIDGTYTEQEMQQLVLQINPKPKFYWLSKSNGIHLLYTKLEPFDADELAALAYFAISTKIKYDRIEIKTDSRFPPNEYHIHSGTTKALLNTLGLYTIDDIEVQTFLASSGFEHNKRYKHSLCPVDPSDSQSSDPVLIGDKGIFCFVCEAHNKTYGSNKAGFFPYSCFVGKKQSSNTLLKCLQNFTHLTHINHILQSEYNLDTQYIALLYRAMLKYIHGNDQRIYLALNRGKDLLRVGFQWCNSNGEPYVQDVKLAISVLPSALYVTKSGQIIQDNEKLVSLQQTHDLTDYGYPSLIPIAGHRIGTHFIESNRNFVVLQRDFIRATPELKPKYIEGDVNAAWETIERQFNKINRNLIYLLIAAKGCMELSIGMSPFIYVYGPTSAGKTTTIDLASGIIGDYNTCMIWSDNIDRLREGILDAKSVGAYVTFNEVIKESRQKKKSPTDALDFLLNLTEASTSWRIFKGHIKLGNIPVVCFTDTELPQELQEDQQLARRVACVHLPESVDWQPAFINLNIKHGSEIRKVFPEECNIIMSYVINRFFRKQQTFFDILNQLEFNKIDGLNNSHIDLLKEFFNLVCGAPEPTGSDKSRWGNKWKVISSSDETPLKQLWSVLADAEFSAGWTRSRRLSEVDWKKILGASDLVKFEVRTHGNTKIAVRFTCGEKCNEDFS